MFQDPLPWMPETPTVPKPERSYTMFHIYIYMKRFNLAIRHSMRLTTVTNYKTEQL